MSKTLSIPLSKPQENRGRVGWAETHKGKSLGDENS